MDEPLDDFLTRWQQLHFEMHHVVGQNDNQQKSGQSDCKIVEKQADVIRNTLAQLQFARFNSCASSELYSHLFQQQAKKYGTVIDNPTTQGGLDNFAELALSQTEGKPNESQKWKSSLTLKNLSEKSYIKEFLTGQETFVDCLLPTIDIASKPASSTAGTLPITGPPPYVEPTANHHAHHQAPSQNVKSFKPMQPNREVMIPGNIDCSSSGRGLTSGRNNVSESGRPSGNFWNMSRQAENTGNMRNNGGGRLYGNPAGCDDRQPPYQSMKRQWACDEDTEEDQSPASTAFRTAREQLIMDDQKKHNRGGSLSSSSYGSNKKSLGTRRGLNTRFVPPVLSRDDDDDYKSGDSMARKMTSAVLGPKGSRQQGNGEEILDERLKNLDPKMVELITNEIMDHGPPVAWDDIAGLEFAKKTIKEIVIWPMLRPDIFTGLRGPPKGLLLFGPPGTGKTLIGKCIASQSKSTFFSISASSLTSKWVGEGEKMVRALFGVARVHQPAVIFMDEIDSLLSQRTDGEHESSRRIKTEFLVQLDGATTGENDRILVVGATNRPQEIDEAARRRFMKRLYIPLPEGTARSHIIINLLSQQSHDLSPDETEKICAQTDGYSGSDMANLCREAALGPIRSMTVGDIENITADQVRPIRYKDFQDALTQVRASVSQKDLDVYLDWNKQYGSWDVT